MKQLKIKKTITVLFILPILSSCDADPSGKFTFFMAMPMLLLAWIVGKIVRSPWDDKKNSEDIVDAIISIIIGFIAIAIISAIIRGLIN